MGNPTVVLVHGAWHQPAHYSTLIAELEEMKYNVVTGRLPSVGSPNPKDQSLQKDGEFVRDTLLGPLLELGKDVIVVAHSYGGAVAGHAAKGLSKSERAAAGQEGGILGLIFICAFVANEGDSLLSKLPDRKYEPWTRHNIETGQLTTVTPKEVFYNDVDDAAAEQLVALLLPQAEAALSTPGGPPAWADAAFDNKRAYIQAEQDHAIPFVAQDAMVTYSGVQWDVLKLDASHSPFWSHTKEVANYIVSRARAYATQ